MRYEICGFETVVAFLHDEVTFMKSCKNWTDGMIGENSGSIDHSACQRIGLRMNSRPYQPAGVCGEAETN